MLFYIVLFLGTISLWWHWRARDRMKVTNLTGKYIFITGCDTGFGNMAAKTFDKKGFRVFASCLTETGAKELKAETSNQLQTVLLDVRDSDSVKKVAAWIKAEVQSEGLWGLINNAGIMGPSAPTDWRDMKAFGVNVSCIQPGLFKTPLSSPVKILKEKEIIWNQLPPRTKKQYGEEYFQKDAAKKEKLTKICLNEDISLVVECMEHALTSLYPRTHYIIGQDAKWFWTPLSKMPAAVQDFLLLRNRAKPAASHAN
ncbi:dehydrogenase/reductase SDR family member 9 isoform X3 [Anas acuta]|uniref:dehydrogenase/reductase SDR family member 9 isoform X3 n=1 Tax=Anas acuta TaxID=28680 RepID=UPI0035C8AF2A